MLTFVEWHDAWEGECCIELKVKWNWPSKINFDAIVTVKDTLML